MTPQRRRVAIARHGGGSHTAFTARVLKGLLGADRPPAQPSRRPDEPRTGVDIADRRDELSGNPSLHQELHCIEKINRLLDKGLLAAHDRYRNVTVRVIEVTRSRLSRARARHRSSTRSRATFADGAITSLHVVPATPDVAAGARLVTMAVSAGVITCEACGRRNRVPSVARGVPRCAQCHTPLPWMADADTTTFDTVADSSRIAVLVDLWAPWCGPCRMVSPALERLARERAGRLKLVKVNVDEAPEVSERFGVRGIPTLLLMRHGAIVARQTGAPPEAALQAWLDGALRDADRATPSQ